MKILALEPYYGGSHKAFLDGWISGSSHEWTLCTLPPRKWKWRMRHAAFTFAQMVKEKSPQEGPWDALFCTDMLNLAEFKGLALPKVRDLPSVFYFHENQLTYPVRHEDERDYHFVISNILSALAADAVWFNSSYHKEEFLGSLPGFLKKMPDYQLPEAVEQVRSKSTVRYPGVNISCRRNPHREGPAKLLWAARWEHDKNPALLFEALRICVKQGTEFTIDVIGEQFRESPEVFESARTEFGSQINRWGFQKTREEYEQCLCGADIVISTADHEFFGISVVEAVCAGAFPLLPDRLAYPELFSPANEGGSDDFFYNGTAEHLAERITGLADRIRAGSLWGDDPQLGLKTVEKYRWDRIVPQYDEAIEEVISH